MMAADQTPIRRRYFSGAGRKRLAGPREPNGRLQRPSASAKQENVMAVAMAQPHRQGRATRYAGFPAGNLMLAGELTGPELGALERYVRLTHEAHRVIPQVPKYPSIMADGGGSGADLDLEEITRIRRDHADAMSALTGYGSITHDEMARTLMRVCVQGWEVTTEREIEVICLAAKKLCSLWREG